jgi:hypothetical protein
VEKRLLPAKQIQNSKVKSQNHYASKLLLECLPSGEKKSDWSADFRCPRSNYLIIFLDV